MDLKLTELKRHGVKETTFSLHCHCYEENIPVTLPIYSFIYSLEMFHVPFTNHSHWIILLSGPSTHRKSPCKGHLRLTFLKGDPVFVQVTPRSTYLGSDCVLWGFRRYRSDRDGSRLRTTGNQFVSRLSPSGMTQSSTRVAEDYPVGVRVPSPGVFVETLVSCFQSSPPFG